jgi:hypothetical protein
MSNSIFDTPEGRKAAFMTLYKEQKYNIIEIAKELDISVIPDETMPNTALGFIRYKKFIRYKNNKFEIVVNNIITIRKLQMQTRVIMTIAHGVAHWIYDYNKIKDGAVLWEKITDIFDTKEEKRAMQVANNITMGLNNIFPK